MRNRGISFTICLLAILMSLIADMNAKVDEKSCAAEEERIFLNQEEKEENEEKEKPEKKDEVLHYEVIVTATRTEKDTFEIPNPVSVVNREDIVEQAPNNISDLFFEMPGVDVNGIGANQSRPVIRGLRGQRILLMEDGIRMNSSRRQQDFGEIPAMVDVAGIERVEVVRGPASVLYGSDAIGGVINIITKVPDYGKKGTKIHGNFGYRFDSAGSQHKGEGNINGRFGNLGFMLSGTYRDTGNYKAPAGTFGQINLVDDAVVHDTGVQDHSMNLYLGYRLADHHDLALKYEYYNFNDAGFGYVDPDVYNPGSTRIQIIYPFQKVNKLTLRYENRALNFFLADGATLNSYYLRNKRRLDMNIFVPFGIPWLPEAGLEIQSENFTDVETFGFRLECTKVVRNRHIFTYGVDYFHDNSQNTDTNSFQTVGFGPSQPDVDTTPQLPYANYSSLGIFLQDDVSLFSRASLILGLRYQNVSAKTKETPGLGEYSPVNSVDRTLVGSASFTYGLTDELRLVAGLGRGFRSPNLIERFFDGLTPAGEAYQSRNLDLKAETSFNIDLGLKYRHRYVYFETTYFINTIYDGIRIVPTGGESHGFPEYKNDNIDKLRMQGIESLGSLSFNIGISITANFTYLASKNLGDPDLPYVDTYSSKLNFHVRYDHPKGLFWGEYHIRHSGDQKDVNLGDNPIGSIIPGFTVHNLRGGITLFKNSSYPQRLGIIIANITNTLYSEFSNASFFRPAPSRHLVLTWSLSF